MADETQYAEEKGPLPRSREAVDWWLKKWGRDAVVAGTEPLTREDVERLIEANGGTAEGLYLAGADLHGAILVRADLRGAILWNTNLRGANLEEANLRDADFELANLQGANLVRANLQSAKFGEANLQGANLSGANLQEALLVLAKLEGAALGWADLVGANLTWANLRGVNLFRARLQKVLLTEGSIFPDTNLEMVEWDPKYINVLEQRGDYEAASAVYRRLKEWYRGAGMLTIAGEFHFREQEASRKAGWQRLGRQFKERLAAAWRELKAGDVAAPPEE